MNLAVLKGALALAGTAALLVGAAILYRRRGTLDAALQLLGVACFVVVALAHVFEALAILPALGWGHPRSVGHYIDMAAAVLGVTLVSASLFFRYVQRGPRVNTRDDPGAH